MKQHGKKYLEASKKIDNKKFYLLNEAIELLTETSITKFDSTVEIHLNLGIDPKQANEQIRNIVNLPNGTGKKVKIIAFVTDDKIKDSLAAGAIKAGAADLIAEVQGGYTDFDKAIAMPSLMKDLAKVAKVLGPKGLMPNPKAGTVTDDVIKTIKDLQGGRIEFRNDKQSNVHNAVGKISFSKEKLLENIKEYLKAIKAAKPAEMKGNYIKSMFLTTTMGPSIRLDINAVLKEV
jgi:large subunit ribosomal protein L1